jgi:general stress protein 26
LDALLVHAGRVTNKNNKMVAELKKNDKVLRHVVIFKFREEASEAEVQKISDSFNALPNHISVIQSFEWGLNDSPEDLHQGFTHCYMLTFNSEEERDGIYTPHPKHQAFVASLKPHLEKVFVIDYWTK